MAARSSGPSEWSAVLPRAGRQFSLNAARRLLRKEQAAGYCCDQAPVLLSQTFAASKFCSVLMYTALCTYDACVMSCSGEVIG
jgi:hypothetical protein